MKQLFTRSVFTLALSLAAAAPEALRAAVLVEPLPASGNLTAAPGQTVGWGLSISSDTAYFVATAVNFLPGSAQGAFTDLLSPRLTPLIVGPGPLESPAVTEAFNELAGTGLGSFAVSAAATLNSFVNGSILVGYDLYSVSPNDPSFDPGLHLLEGGLTASLDASVFVTGAAEVPEPATVVLAGIALAGAAWQRRRAACAHAFLPRK